jgi:CRISPR-associated endonuclease/helicase Cas3
MPFYSYWGKAGERGLGTHLLPYHSLDVAAVGEVLLIHDHNLRQRLTECAGLPEQAFRGLVRFFLAAHDLGKFSFKFQAKSQEAMRFLHHEPLAVAPAERHDRLGWRLWEDSLRSRVDDGRLGPGRGRKWLRFWRAWGRAFLGHHGVPPDLAVSIAERPIAEDFQPADVQAAEAYLSAIADLFELPHCLADLPPIHLDEGGGIAERCSWFLAGLAILCDWLGSWAECFPPEIQRMPLETYWRERALPAAERALAASGILPSRVRTVDDPTHVLPHLANRALSPLQNAAWDAGRELGGPRLLIFEDLTGSGKTEAAMLAAFGLMRQDLADGVFFALPTQATSNAMYARIAAVYPYLFEPGSRPSLVLAHGNRGLSDAFLGSIERRAGETYDAAEDGRAWCAAWLADHKKRALLAAVGVGTIDQALLGVLPSRHQSLRLLGTARSVLVVDEVHAYDEYVTGLLETLLQFQAAHGGSAILLSATLPQGLRQRLVEAYTAGMRQSPPVPPSCQSTDFPLLTCLAASGLQEQSVPARQGTQRRTSVEFVAAEHDILDRIDGVTAAGGCVLWVRNTVADAIAAYDQLVARYGDNRVLLFHARFALCDRAERETQVLDWFGPESTPVVRRGRIVVATQVAEQSLDVDFDLVFSDLAPIEGLIQRAGRCMRHVRPDRPAVFSSPTLVIFAPPWDIPVVPDWYSMVSRGAARVYPFHGRLWLGAAWLREHGGFHLPHDARKILESVYGEGAETRVPSALREHDDCARAEADLAASWACHNTLNLEAGYTADGNPWRDEEDVTTRLGEPTVTLRLCRVEGERLVPWDEQGPRRQRWPRSDVTVRLALCSRVETGGIADAWIAEARDQMADGGQWSRVLPLRLDEAGCWVGLGWNASGDQVCLFYSRQKGLWLDRP